MSNIKYSGGTDTLNIPDTFLEGNPDNYIVMNISGNAYIPYYLDGDKLIISCDLTKPNHSNVYLVEIDNLFELRKATKFNSQTIVLESINPNIPPKTVVHGQYNVIGFPYMLIRAINGGMPQ